MVNHLKKNETAKIVVAPHLAGMVNHTTMKVAEKIWHVQWTPSTIQDEDRLNYTTDIICLARYIF